MILDFARVFRVGWAFSDRYADGTNEKVVPVKKIYDGLAADMHMPPLNER